MLLHFLAPLLLLAMPIAGHAVPAGTEQEILERIEPLGELCLAGQNCAGKIEPAGASAPRAPEAAPAAGAPADDASTVADTAAASGRTGEDVYSTYCFACHAAGVAGAPLFGNAEQWEPRIEKGMDAMLQSTIEGIPPLMPPKGTCMDCSEQELASAVEYMVDAVQ